MKLLATVCLALVAAAAATTVPFQVCDSQTYSVNVSNIDVNPYPIQPGSAVTITVSGSVGETIAKGTYDIEVTIFGVPIFSQSGDLCKLDPHVTCPFTAKSINISESLTVPSEAPPGTYGVKVSANGNSTSDLLFCITANITIGGSAPQAAATKLRQRPTKKTSKVPDSRAALQHDLIQYVNSLNTSWTAGYNKRFRNTKMKHVKALCGVIKVPGAPVLKENTALRYVSRMIDIPDAFDAREQWGDMCPSTKDVRDQGACGSCWAFGAAEAMTDRVCIASQGQQQPYLSAEDLTSCCASCGMGCEGGDPGAAFDYWATSGLVTGGPYNSQQGCYPYQIAACDHHVVGKLPPCGDIQNTPPCTQSCQNGAVWSQDKHFGASAFNVPSDVASIQTEIMTNGPVEAAFTVYEDFVSYKSGVYYHVSGDELGGHAIKVFGWGTDSGVDYWWVANSWNQDWGDNGFFKIRRGTDECGIEDDVVAGAPKLS